MINFQQNLDWPRSPFHNNSTNKQLSKAKLYCTITILGSIKYQIKVTCSIVVMLFCGSTIDNHVYIVIEITNSQWADLKRYLPAEMNIAEIKIDLTCSSWSMQYGIWINLIWYQAWECVFPNKRGNQIFYLELTCPGCLLF